MSGRPFWILLPLFLLSCDDHLLGECDEDTKAYDPTWAGVEELFVAQCVVCHTADGSAGFDLSVAIEGELSDGNPDNNFYVIPGDPENSVLWLSLAWTDPAVAPMPGGAQQPLSECVSGHVYDWIAAGAEIPGQALTSGTTAGSGSR